MVRLIEAADCRLAALVDARSQGIRDGSIVCGAVDEGILLPTSVGSQ